METMAAQPVTETIRGRITLSPGEPRAFPTFSVWQDPPHTVANAQSVDLPTAADVVIIGSGITGCAVAHTLLRKTTSLSVTVLEARQTASGATGRNGGHLLSDNLFLIPKYVPTIGVEAAGEVAHFSNKNSTRIRDLVQTLNQEERDAVGLREVLATAAFGDVETLEQAKKDLQVLQQIHPESARQYKIIAAEDAIQKYNYSKDIVGVVECQGGAALSPYRLITAIFRQLLEQYPDRFTLETNTVAQSIHHNQDNNRAHTYTVSTSRGSIMASKIIHCTNAFAGHLIPHLRGRLFPVRGTMSAQQPGPSFPNVGDRISWSYFCKPSLDVNTGEFFPGLYYAQQNVRSGAIFIGGERQGLTDLLSSDDSVIASDARESLCRVLPRVFSDVEPVGKQKAWSGIIGLTSDGLPLVGQLNKAVTDREGDGEWLAAGFNGHGMNKCWLTGEAVAEMSMGSTPKDFPTAFLVSKERYEKMGVDQALEIFFPAT